MAKTTSMGSKGNTKTKTAPPRTATAKKTAPVKTPKKTTAVAKARPTRAQLRDRKAATAAGGTGPTATGKSKSTAMGLAKKGTAA